MFGFPVDRVAVQRSLGERIQGPPALRKLGVLGVNREIGATDRRASLILDSYGDDPALIVDDLVLWKVCLQSNEVDELNSYQGFESAPGKGILIPLQGY